MRHSNPHFVVEPEMRWDFFCFFCSTYDLILPYASLFCCNKSTLRSGLNKILLYRVLRQILVKLNMQNINNSFLMFTLLTGLNIYTDVSQILIWDKIYRLNVTVVRTVVCYCNIKGKIVSIVSIHVWAIEIFIQLPAVALPSSVVYWTSPINSADSRYA